MKFKERIAKWWYFTMRNPVVRVGEVGGFKWRFRRFWLEITTVSGNFSAKFTASEHPYGYLVAGKSDDNIEGYCQTIYMVSMLLTTDQGFVDDVNKAIKKYQKRLEKAHPIVEDAAEEMAAMEGEKSLMEHLELPKEEREKVEKDIDKRFNRTLKEAKKNSV